MGSASHIFVLLMYCNETILQYKYKKFGCRKVNEEMTRKEFKAMNAEIGHWYQLLFEAITFFGTKVTPTNVFYTGLNVKLSFASFVPRFYCPFSTTISVDIANGFCDENGIILQMQPTVVSRDVCFNVEWLSVYFHERERLFFRAFDLLIVDIHFVRSGELMKHRKYLRAFTLFSGLFDGHFVSKLKGQRKAEKVLLDLIAVYGQNNNIDVEHGNNGNICIPLYIQQIFYNLIRSFGAKKKHWIIPSEFEKIGDALKSQLFRFKENGDDHKQCFIVLSPFLDAICKYGVDQLGFYEEYIWVISDDRIRELREGGPGSEIWSELEYKYKLSDSEKISFVFRMNREAIGLDTAGFGLLIKKCPDGLHSGRTSVAIDGDVDWNRNNWSLNKMKEGSFSGMFAFDDTSFETMQSLNVRIAIRF